ncbi:MAG: DUF456 domain-containing protein [Desulfobacteraceae bacterium]
MAIALIILGLLCALAGIVGCILPIIPGPPISFLALIFLSIAKNWEPFGPNFLFIMGGLAVLVSVLDYVVPVIGAKRYGASKPGIWISMMGMLVGVLFFPPWGMLTGAFLGALAGELLAGKKGRKSLQAAWGAFVGNVVSIGFKLAYCGVIIFFFVKKMF